MNSISFSPKTEENVWCQVGTSSKSVQYLNNALELSD